MGVFVSGSFDDLRSRDVRFLHEASRLGELHVLLRPDQAVLALTGMPPKFPQDERLYFLEAIRYVTTVRLLEAPLDPDSPAVPEGPAVWVLPEAENNARKGYFCRARGIECRVIPDSALGGFPIDTCERPQAGTAPARPKVIVTGCFDWLHSGHVRFFEEAAEIGDLYVVVGHDQNLRLLKGQPHPLFCEDERRYTVDSIRYVHCALISTGHGWMDAEPEIARIRPDIYLVNEDGDRPEKRAFCDEHGLQYMVLKRRPRLGLQPRQSTHLRGF